MNHKVVTHSLRELADADRLGMFTLRYDTFFTRLGWDVETTDDGQEIDQYDKDDRSKYILAKSPLGIRRRLLASTAFLGAQYAQGRVSLPSAWPAGARGR